MPPDASRRLIFLGGTAGTNPWRGPFIEQLVRRGVKRESCFDPVVADWNDEARAREERAKRDADLLLFYLADPMQPGLPVSAYALVEATLAVCNDPARTLLVFDVESVSGHARKVLEQSEKLLREQGPGVPMFRSLEPAASWIAERFAR